MITLKDPKVFAHGGPAHAVPIALAKLVSIACADDVPVVTGLRSSWKVVVSLWGQSTAWPVCWESHGPLLPSVLFGKLSFLCSSCEHSGL